MTDGLAHSPIGASSMSRWSKCPASVRLSKGIPNKSSKYAEEGTIAHQLAADLLEGKASEVKPTQEMLDAVQVYRNQIIEDKNEFGMYAMHVEVTFDLQNIHPGLFGTADCVIWHPDKKLLRVYDYKHGAGIAVDVINNQQLKYYGLGAMDNFGYPAEIIELIVVQPRCSHPDGPIRRWSMTSMDMLEFASELTLAAQKTEDPSSEIVPGDHCRFCLAAPTCPKLTEKALEVAQKEFSVEEIKGGVVDLSKAMEWLPALEAFIKNVREVAYREACHGNPPKGYKLVNKKATRKWKMESEAISFIEGNFRYSSDDLYTKKFKSVAAMEKIIKKKEDFKLVQHLIEKISSGTTLALESDKRPEVKQDAATEFDILS